MGYCRRSVAHLPGLGADISDAQPEADAGAYLQLDNTRHFILSAAFVYRNPVFYDMFTKLSSL